MKCRDPAMANGGMLSMATRVARNVVPHDTHTAIQAQYARRSCLGDESDAGLNGTTILRKPAVHAEGSRCRRRRPIRPEL